MEYGSVIWNPYQIGQDTTGFVEVPKEQLRLDLQVPNLETRRFRLDLMFLFRLINGLIECTELLELVDVKAPRTTRSCFVKRHYSIAYGFSTISRILRARNTMSTQVNFLGQSTDSFRRRLENETSAVRGI
ncbi:hypothetical protein J6590_003269 [Homalodisca vitripennis]|nr:hypothetical protein J6590_003269 [Homalodisca vitripennis]